MLEDGGRKPHARAEGLTGYAVGANVKLELELKRCTREQLAALQHTVTRV